jgi:peptidoglycan/LPS O-acetylase OafA/YrhL
MHYRADIDGLRAVAVLLVVLFHAEVPGFEGGFVGVDVFFVISGYLIASLVRSDLDAGRFSLAEFYERRIRRILPALLVVLAFASAASFTLLPGALKQYGQSVAAAAAMLSNVLFWHEAGYFADPSAAKPLLHTWSLAVEEQFYLCFPLAFALVYRRWRALVVPLALLVSFASFGIAEWWLRSDPDAAFFLAPSRAWELLAGSLLAITSRVRAPTSAPWSNGIAALGLGMIAWSAATMTESSSFPGSGALLPVIGTALIVVAGKESDRFGVVRLLGAKPLVAIGLISYSLYLWHFPLLVYARQLALRELTSVETALVIGVAFGLSTLSWRVVEQPFRGRRVLAGRPLLFAASALALGSAAAFGFAAHLGGGWPGRLDTSVVALAAGADDRTPDPWRCGYRSAEDVREGRLCRIGAPDAEPSFLVWGDSHADALFETIEAVAAERGVAGLFATRPGCPALLDVVQARTGYRTPCRRFGEATLALIESRPDLERVLLISRWAIYAHGERYGVEPGELVRIVDSQSRRPSKAENLAVFARGMRRTLGALAALERRVAVLAQVPEVGWPVPIALARAEMFEQRLEIEPTLDDYLARQAFFFALLDELAATLSVHVLRPHEVLCEGGACRVRQGNRSLYYDSNHLSRFGSRQIAEVLGAALVADSRSRARVSPARSSSES